MGWPALLASTARLLDLHDCDRTAGAMVSAPAEYRAGSNTGIWLDVAVQLMQYLYERDLESNDAWVPIEEIVIKIIQRHNISREDILFVANYLATPTRIVSVKDVDAQGVPYCQTLKRETALIEWPRNTKARDRCRLSSSGSRSVQLSQAAHKWLYTADDAGKLVKAIEHGAYSDIPYLADSLIAQIRRFSKEITMLLERRHMGELLTEFLARRNAYLKVIKDVQSSVEAAIDLFRTKQAQEYFKQWLISQKEGQFSSYTIQHSFTDTLQAVERLNRKFQNLVSVLVSEKREVFGLIRFDKAAVGLAFVPCSQNITELCITALGPWYVESAAPSFIDFEGMFEEKLEEKSSAVLKFEDDPVEKLPSPIERFLSAHKEQILETLQHGAVSLSDAIVKGWFKVDDLDVLPQLVGVYVAPDWLGENNNALAVSIKPGALNAMLPDGSRLEGDDLILHWIELGTQLTRDNI
jgi:hypothetical protein